MSDYRMILQKLSNMDEKQIIELLHDLTDSDGSGLRIVEKISNCAVKFLDDYEPPSNGEESEWTELKRQDDAQRYQDIKSTMDRMR